MMKIQISAANEHGQWWDRAFVRSIPEAIAGVITLTQLPHITAVEARLSGDSYLKVDLVAGTIERTGRFA